VVPRCDKTESVLYFFISTPLTSDLLKIKAGMRKIPSIEIILYSSTDVIIISSFFSTYHLQNFTRKHFEKSRNSNASLCLHLLQWQIKQAKSMMQLLYAQIKRNPE